jgi:poly-beta-hydroxyalkanoate depolymerase
VQRHEYEFVPVDVRRDPTAYRAVAAERARDGWRLVQVHIEVPAAVPAEVTLVLERPAAA